MSEWLKDTRAMTEEELLLDYVERLEKHRDGRRAVEVKLSQLRPYNQRPHHIRIVKKAFEPLVRKYQAGIYELSNNNIMVLTKGASVAEIEACVLHVRFLFSEDPLFQGSPGGDLREADFCDWFDAEVDFDKLLHRARSANEDRQKIVTLVAAAARATQPLEDTPGTILSPTNLEQIEKIITRADLANVMRRQQICAVIGKTKPNPVFHEIYFSMSYLAQQVMPGCNVTADQWLFQHLTRTLDTRMLALMTQRENAPMLKSASINLSLGTILSPEFLEFDKSINNRERGPLSIEIPSIEVLAEPADYLFARDFLKERGYKLILDCVKHLNLPLFDRQRFGFDFIKLIWSPNLYDDTRGARRIELQDAIHRIGSERVVLCRCDSEMAIIAGEELGISLYQGRLIDALLQPRPATEAAKTARLR